MAFVNDIIDKAARVLGVARIIDSGGVNVASVSAAGALKTDGSAATQPVSGTVAVSNFPATQPVSAASLPLPTGASTAALQTQPGVDIGDVTVNNAAGAAAVNVQDGGNSITVDGTVAVSNFPATQPVSGTVAVSNFPATQPVSGSVTVLNGAGAAAVNIQDGGNSITVDGVFFQATQPVSAVSLPLPTGAATAANQTTANTSLASIDTKTLAAGQATMAASSPVVIASNQTAIPISAASLPLPTGAATAANQPGFGTAGTPSANVLTVQGISSGTPINVNKDGMEATYGASITALAPAAVAPTDIFEIAGSATKTVKVRRVRITGTRTASTTSDLILLKRSTANTAGTSTTPTRVPNDSTSAAATAVVKAYTANPTVGTLVGNLRADKQFLNIAGTGTGDVREYNATDGGGQPIILRGVAETLCLNLNGVAMTGGNLDIWVEWSEV